MAATVNHASRAGWITVLHRLRKHRKKSAALPYFALDGCAAYVYVAPPIHRAIWRWAAQKSGKNRKILSGFEHRFAPFASLAE